MKKTIILFYIFIFSSVIIFSQIDTSFYDESNLEDLIEESTIDAEDSQLFDLLEELLDNPIDLNQAEFDDLIRIPFIDSYTAQIILSYGRSKIFKEVNDLYSIEQLDKELIKKIIPYLIVKSKSTTQIIKPLEKNIFENTSIEFRTRVINNLQVQKGFYNNKYEGSKIKSYNRLKIKYAKNIQLGILTEKDPGEKSYFDFMSYHLYGEQLYFDNKFVLGDYLLEFGHGLALWSPYSFSKGSDAVKAPIKNAKIIRPYTSADESQFFRGLATEFSFNNLKARVFYSQNFFDATYDSLKKTVTSINYSGYHRTENEKLKENNIRETFWGGSIEYSFSDKISFGILYYNTKFDKQFEQSSFYGLEGMQFEFLSTTYKIFLDKIYLTGEFSYNSTSIASLNIINIPLSKNFIITTSIRNYPRNYYNIHSNGFGETARTQNEVGYYLGFLWRTDIGNINFYYDQFKFPFPTYSNPLPSKGNEFLLYYSTKPFKRTEIITRVKNENKEITEKINDEDALIIQNKYNLRFEVIYQILKEVRLKTRFEYVTLNNDLDYKEDGFLTYQDIQWKPSKQFDLYTRIIFFKTDSYNSRLYEFENDITGVITNPAMYGEGIKWYFLIKYKVLDFVSFSMKYSELYKPKEISLGSGDSEIPTNLSNLLSLQIDVKL
ncbi:MAG: helix-hairpin-helix domain-containing protein [Ignavibacteriales bacterium]|nr:helix-hairpin-helix domain-containing protein [Ignavibacteriales bacterium]